MDLVWKMVPFNPTVDQTAGPDSFNCVTLSSHFISLVPHFLLLKEISVWWSQGPQPGLRHILVGVSIDGRML